LQPGLFFRQRKALPSWHRWSSVEPKKQPRLCQPEHQLKTTCSIREMGERATSSWWRVALVRDVPGPPMSSTAGPAVKPPACPSRPLSNGHYQQHLRQPRQQPRPLVSKRGGGKWTRQVDSAVKTSTFNSKSFSGLQKRFSCRNHVAGDENNP